MATEIMIPKTEAGKREAIISGQRARKELRRRKAAEKLSTAHLVHGLISTAEVAAAGFADGYWGGEDGEITLGRVPVIGGLALVQFAVGWMAGIPEVSAPAFATGMYSFGNFTRKLGARLAAGKDK